MRTINDRAALPLTAVFTDDGKFAAPAVHDHQFVVGIFDHIDIDKFNFSDGSGTNIRLFNPPAGRTADVEGPHGQLGARLTDGLGGKDAHRLAHLNRSSMGQVPAIALGAQTMFGAAGQGRANQDRGHTRILNFLSIIFIDFPPARTTTSSVKGSNTSFTVVRPRIRSLRR
jgi:hypothetical protein